MADEISWDEAVKSAGFVRLEQDENKEITVKNWRLEEVEKFGEKTIEFQADCIEEDGEKVDKQFTTTSNRLKKKLRPIFENKQSSDEVKISIMMVGEKFNTQFPIAI